MCSIFEWGSWSDWIHAKCCDLTYLITIVHQRLFLSPTTNIWSGSLAAKIPNSKCFFHSATAVQLQLLPYIGIVSVSRPCVSAYRQLSFHCRVDVDGIRVNVRRRLRVKEWRECSGFTARRQNKSELSFVFWCYTVCDMSWGPSCVLGFMWPHEWSLEFYWCDDYVCRQVHDCVYMRWRMCELWTTSSFHTQTDIKGGLN